MGDDIIGLNILVVEDEYYIAVELKRDLEAQGAVLIGPVGSVAGALALIEASQAIDAAVLDVNLNGNDVFPVADKLLERGTPFLFASGYGSRDIPARYRHIPRIDKPYVQGELTRTFAKLLR